MFRKTIDKKPTMVDAKGSVIKDLTMPIYKRTNQFQLNYTLKMTTIEQQMRPDLISIAEYGSDEYTEDILKLNGISNPFSMQSGQILMIFDDKDIESLRLDANKTNLIEPYERLQNKNIMDNKPNTTGDGYVNTHNDITPLLKRNDVLTRKPYDKYEVDPITKKFINPNKLPDLDSNNALDKITVGGRKKRYKEPNYNNEDLGQFTVKDGIVILGPPRDEVNKGNNYIPIITDGDSNSGTSGSGESGITNTENLPEDLKEIVDKDTDCKSGDNNCKDKYPEAHTTYLKNRDLKPRRNN